MIYQVLSKVVYSSYFLFKHNTHHGQVYDPLLQGEDEPRRHQSYQVLRDTAVGRPHPCHPPISHTQTKTTESCTWKPGGWQRGTCCQNLPDLERMKRVASEHLLGVQKNKSRLRKRNTKTPTLTGCSRRPGTFLVVFTDHLILDHADISYLWSKAEHLKKKSNIIKQECSAKLV